MGKLIKKAAVIGTGLMGGSLALALKEHGCADRVFGYDVSPETRKYATEIGIADVICDNLTDAVSGCDLLFLATPVGVMIEVLKEVRDILEPGAIVSDIASVKLSLTREIEELLPDEVHYIGGHPMTGSEHFGIESARSDLFIDCYYILTPTPKTDTDAFGKIHRLLGDLGARVISMEPEIHDRAVATVSHIPHILSLLLMDYAVMERKEIKNLFTIAAGGFRDMTRIAASNPEMWADIAIENRDFITGGLQSIGKEVDELVSMLTDSDRDGLVEIFNEARLGRLDLALPAGRKLEDIYEISLPATDRPGVISEISTAVGALGINIEDIEIVHTLVGESGILNLRIDGYDNACNAADHLNNLGYRAVVRGV